jgi:hypothetical protein
MAKLAITLTVSEANREAAADVYSKYKQPFLDGTAGATSKDLLLRVEDAQVLHGFDSVANALGYLSSELFTKDIVAELSPLLEDAPEVRIYDEVERRVVPSRSTHTPAMRHRMQARP